MHAQSPDAARLRALFPALADNDALEVLEAPRGLRCARIAEVTGDAPADVARRLATACELPFADTWAPAANPGALASPSVLHEYAGMPEARDTAPGALPLVTAWPPSERDTRWIKALCGRAPEWRMAAPESVEAALRAGFGVGAGSLDAAEAALADDTARDEAEDEAAAVIRFVRDVIARGASDRATDIHFEPGEGSLNIRYRIDGVLVPVPVPANLVRFQSAILSRLKLMAKLDIAERRRPQDGRIGFSADGNTWDIRVSTLPTLHGESVSLRLLAANAEPPGIGDLGFLPDDEKALNGVLARPHGIILVTGPTGSGKSTTLNACLRRVRSPELRLMTVEDPVEYRVTGVNQTQVQPEIGLTFANVLRSVLRQDPDVIMVGEIRDRETADIAIRAALTGHLVMSTLHTNDAAGAVTRLTDMGVEPFLIASALEMVIAQRLVRRLCTHCSAPMEYTPEWLASRLAALDVDPAEAYSRPVLRRPVGCEHCRGIGYKGRLAIVELLPVSDSVHPLIVERRPASDIREAALKDGMRTLQLCGWEQVKRGLTTLDAVLTYAEKSL